MSSRGDRQRIDFLPGTLDLIVLRTLQVMGPQHAYAIATRIEHIADGPVRLNQGSLYPALVRLEQKGWIKGAWKTPANNREARYYAITKSGARELEAQVDRWQRSTGLVNRLLGRRAMSALRRFVARVACLRRPGRADSALARELDAHLAFLTDEYRRRVLSPDAAWRAAVMALDGVVRSRCAWPLAHRLRARCGP